jgi:hypothetical protein
MTGPVPGTDLFEVCAAIPAGSAAQTSNKSVRPVPGAAQ